MAEVPTYQPMLATRHPAPFSDPEWAFEVKWDGVRAIAGWDGEELTVRSRTGRVITPTYPELESLRALPPCVLDGEIVAFDERGRPSFGLLQQRMNLRSGARASSPPISFMAFDLLHQDVPLIGQPWSERRRLLAGLPLPVPFVVAEPVVGDGDALWEAVVEEGLEGMVGKQMDSTYRPGIRSNSWRKVGRVDQVRAVVGGYLPGEGSRASSFGSLLLGLVEGDNLRYIGSVGTGFAGETLGAIREALDEMTTSRSPIQPGTEIDRHAVFVDPQLTALVEFKEWTRAGRLRAPSFKGFTDDGWEAATWAAEGPPTPKTGSGPAPRPGD
jgi:bifunctional non-homologous end joining protein LigD